METTVKPSWERCGVLTGLWGSVWGGACVEAQVGFRASSSRGLRVLGFKGLGEAWLYSYTVSDYFTLRLFTSTYCSVMVVIIMAP